MSGFTWAEGTVATCCAESDTEGVHEVDRGWCTVPYVTTVERARYSVDLTR